MGADKPYKKVQRTNNYSMFKRLEGNRDVSEIRVKKIISSIKKVGYITSPIIVNQKYQVIDGQGRLEALKRLQMPIDYIVEPGAGIDECIAMNINQTNWRIIDYIESYAEMGNVSYMYTLNLLKAYGKTFQHKVIMHAITGKCDNHHRLIKDGSLVCTAEDYNRAQAILSYLSQFTGVFDRLKGHNEFYYNVIAYCFEDPEVDNERLHEKVVALQANLIPVSTVLQAFDVIENIYNNRARAHVYIKTNYRKAMADKYSWYNNLYGKRYDSAED